MTDDNEETSDSESTDSLYNDNTRMKAKFASLELEVETDDKEDCKELFNETWNMILNDAEDMSEAARDRLSDIN